VSLCFEGNKLTNEYVILSSLSWSWSRLHCWAAVAAGRLMLMSRSIVDALNGAMLVRGSSCVIGGLCGKSSLKK
jgi:hypothetical protein